MTLPIFPGKVAYFEVSVAGAAIGPMLWASCRAQQWFSPPSLSSSLATSARPASPGAANPFPQQIDSRTQEDDDEMMKNPARSPGLEENPFAGLGRHLSLGRGAGRRSAGQSAELLALQMSLLCWQPAGRHW